VQIGAPYIEKAGGGHRSGYHSRNLTAFIDDLGEHDIDAIFQQALLNGAMQSHRTPSSELALSCMPTHCLL
jgi:hypothetical protein